MVVRVLLGSRAMRLHRSGEKASDVGAKADAGVGPGKQTRVEMIQRKALAGGGAGVDARGASGVGSPLPDELRGSMESSVGADFSTVRVHQDGAAGAAEARALARGNDVHFAPGEYDASSHGGRALIGHELAHVVQQRAGRVAASAQGKGARFTEDMSLEVEADAAGERAARGEPVAIAGGGSAAGGATGRAIQLKRYTPGLHAQQLGAAPAKHAANVIAAIECGDSGLFSKWLTECGGYDGEDWDEFAHALEGKAGLFTGHLSSDCTPGVIDRLVQIGMPKQLAPPPSVGLMVQPPSGLDQLEKQSSSGQGGLGSGSEGLGRAHILALLKKGCRTFDLAQGYGNQKEIGQAIVDGYISLKIPRSELTLIYKFYPVKGGDVANGVVAIVRQAIADLCVDYLDVIMLHDLNAETGALKANLKAMDVCVQRGLAKRIGLSTVASVEDLQALGTGQGGLPKISYVENRMDPLNQDTQVREACLKLGIHYVGHSVLGGTGNTDAILKHPALIDLASSLGVTVAQLVLAWAMTLGTIQIPKSTNEKRIDENAQARKIVPLPSSIMEKIETLNRKGGGVSEAVELEESNPIQVLKETLLKVVTAKHGETDGPIFAVAEYLAGDAAMFVKQWNTMAKRPIPMAEFYRKLALSAKAFTEPMGDCTPGTLANDFIALLNQIKD
jgi:diketogulonate reductase-like aldo/keto reductase